MAICWDVSTILFVGLLLQTVPQICTEGRLLDLAPRVYYGKPAFLLAKIIQLFSLLKFSCDNL